MSPGAPSHRHHHRHRHQRRLQGPGDSKLGTELSLYGLWMLLGLGLRPDRRWRGQTTDDRRWTTDDRRRRPALPSRRRAAAARCALSKHNGPAREPLWFIDWQRCGHLTRRDGARRSDPALRAPLRPAVPISCGPESLTADPLPERRLGTTSGHRHHDPPPPLALPALYWTHTYTRAAGRAIPRQRVRPAASGRVRPRHIPAGEHCRNIPARRQAASSHGRAAPYRIPGLCEPVRDAAPPPEAVVVLLVDAGAPELARYRSTGM